LWQKPPLTYRTSSCAAAGRAGCKLVEFTGDNASGDDIKALLNYAHDVIELIPRLCDETETFSVLGDPQALS